MVQGGRVPKTVEALGRFLEEHAEAVEADLLRYYRIDLRDLWRGGLSYRRLLVLINKLPMEAWTQTALRDEKFRELVDPEAQKGPEKFGPWRLDNYQLAALTDAVNQLTYLTGVLGRITPKPEPFPPTPRPGLNRPVRRQSEAAVLYLNKLRAKG